MGWRPQAIPPRLPVNMMENVMTDQFANDQLTQWDNDHFFHP